MSIFSGGSMQEYKVMKIDNLLDFDLDCIVKQSKEEGFRFVERLLDDYKSGTNTFNHLGEALFAILNDKGKIIAIGGVNLDPYSNETYVRKSKKVLCL
ncbi:hypothetical protein ACERII_05955 [Evansella sp. AB-rgal1]|uniref:hypothetical protein n=1 Tax=Evansella sp. AB-rgal1 TaxID=3242696 RepID=UPI00359E4EF3